MTGTTFDIEYDFSDPGGDALGRFRVALDPKTLLNAAEAPASPPDWARLDFERCPDCPLAGTSTCPVAARLAEVVSRFADVSSHARVSVEVRVPERTYLQRDVPVQGPLSSLLGVYMSTSGCPVLGSLRPMVRFHLPFASELETVTRATSMYLLGQYLEAQGGAAPDWTLGGLAERYRAALAVNRAFARRLRAAAPRDANINALVRLDSLARSLPELVADRLGELRFLFGL